MLESKKKRERRRMWNPYDVTNGTSPLSGFHNSIRIKRGLSIKEHLFGTSQNLPGATYLGRVLRKFCLEKSESEKVFNYGPGTIEGAKIYFEKKGPTRPSKAEILRNWRGLSSKI